MWFCHWFERVAFWSKQLMTDTLGRHVIEHSVQRNPSCGSGFFKWVSIYKTSGTVPGLPCHLPLLDEPQLHIGCEMPPASVPCGKQFLFQPCPKSTSVISSCVSQHWIHNHLHLKLLLGRGLKIDIWAILWELLNPELWERSPRIYFLLSSQGDSLPLKNPTIVSQFCLSIRWCHRICCTNYFIVTFKLYPCLIQELAESSFQYLFLLKLRFC
jgi:hypothetical protein